MKLILSLFILTSVLMTSLKAETTDITTKPEPLKAKTFVFPSHTEHTLKNGLKVIIIEDHSLPTISFSLLIPGGTSQDANLPGTAEIMAGLLTKGTGKLTALEIATKIDGIGANLSASAGADYVSVAASGLKKHISPILDMFKSIVISPSFPQDEFEKYVQQMAAGLQYEKSQPNKIGAALARKVIYGENHPYATKSTEKNITNISLKDIKNYWAKYFIPNQSTLAVIGDVNEKQILSTLEAAFKDWKKGEKPVIEVAEPKPMPLGVYFVHRTASEQSTIIVTNLGVARNDRDYENLEMAAKVIGSGFAGRLFRTLREKYSYTYSPWGYLTSTKYTNRFACGADVNKDKTDSSIAVILEQITLLGKEGPTADELNRHKRYEVGQYYLAFENSNFLAALIQQSDFLGIPLDQVKNYPQRVNDIDPKTIEFLADTYLNPKIARIIVVGDPSLRPSLEKFGKVFDYNLDLEPITGADAKLDKVSLDPEELMKKHQKAIGTKEAIENVKTIKAKASSQMIVNGQSMEGELIQDIKAPNKMYMMLDMTMFKQEIFCSNGKVIAKGTGQEAEMTGAQAEKIIYEATPFASTKLIELGYKLDIKGSQAGQIIVVTTSPEKVETTFYFDEQTMLLTKYEGLEDSPNGQTPITVKFSDWTLIDGVKLPGKVENISAMFTLISNYSYTLNEDIDDSRFDSKK